MNEASIFTRKIYENGGKIITIGKFIETKAENKTRASVDGMIASNVYENKNGEICVGINFKKNRYGKENKNETSDIEEWKLDELNMKSLSE